MKIKIKQLETDNVAYFSDVHGNMQALKDLEQTALFNDPDITFVFLGDAIDGHGSKTNSKGALKWLMDHPEIIWVPGNHDMFLYGTANYDQDDYKDWLDNGGKQTLKNLGYHHSVHNLEKIEDFLNVYYEDVIERIKQAPNAVETPSTIGVHGGLDMTKAHWQDTSALLSQWLRSAYYEEPSTTTKTIVSGHTPVEGLQIAEKPNAIKISTGLGDRYLIDGGLSSGYNPSALNVLHSNNGIVEVKMLPQFK